VVEARQKKHRGHHEGTTKKRADGRWEARMSLGIVNGKAKYKYYYGKTEAEVKAKMREGQAELQRGKMPGNDRQTVAAFLTDWLAEKKETVRPATYKSYSDTVRLHIIPNIGHKILTKITPVDVRRLLSDLAASGVNPPSIRYTRTVLRAALNQAVRWELVSRNVAALVTSPKVQQREVHPLTMQQAATFLKAAKGDVREGVFAVAVATGLRQGELLGLVWDDIDLDAGALKVRFSYSDSRASYSVCLSRRNTAAVRSIFLRSHWTPSSDSARARKKHGYLLAHAGRKQASCSLRPSVRRSMLATSFAAFTRH